MEEKYKIVVTPQFGVNDENATLIEWCNKNNEKVNKDDLMCIFESTKATFEVRAPNSGYLAILVSEGETIEVNRDIAIIVFDEALIDEILESYKKEKKYKEPKLSITKKAKRLAEKNNIRLDQLSNLDRMIRTQDVEELINEKKGKSPKTVKLKINKNKKSVIVYGAGKGGETISETLELGNEFEVVAFIDDNISGSFLERPVYSINEQNVLLKENLKRIIIAIANGKKRCFLGIELEKNGFELINAIHPNSYISPTATLGKGNHIKSGAIIDTNTIIGNNNIIDNGVIIAHDNIIGDGCHLAPGCVLGSSIEINDYSILGIGSSISTKVKIGKGCIISLNTSVIDDVVDNSLVEGVPGKIIGKTNI